VNINSCNITFKGIYCTATTINNTKIKIDLPGDLSGLVVINDVFENPNTFKIITKANIQEGKSENLKPLFKNIEIDEIDCNSSVYIDLNKKIKIKKIADRGILHLNQTRAVIDEIIGENVAIYIDRGAEFTVKKPSTFTLMLNYLLEKVHEDRPVTIKDTGKLAVISHKDL